MIIYYKSPSRIATLSRLVITILTPQSVTQTRSNAKLGILTNPWAADSSLTVNVVCFWYGPLASLSL